MSEPLTHPRRLKSPELKVPDLKLPAALLIAALPCAAAAQFVPSEESITGLYHGKAYSPYAQRAFPSQVFWGDSHLHTALSADAGLFGNTLGLEPAYRFTRRRRGDLGHRLPVKMAARSTGW